MKSFIDLVLYMDEKIDYLYDGWTKEVSKILKVYLNRYHFKSNIIDIINWFKKNKSYQKDIRNTEKYFRNDLKSIFLIGFQNAGNLVEIKTNKIIKGYDFNPKYNQPKKFEIRKVLSDRVWNLSNENTRFIEYYLKSGIKEGEPSTIISKDLKKYLKYPDKLFRRIRDNKENLKLSKKAKEFKPGQGVYRSSYKNAMRLSRTEVNIAYHRNEHNRWKDLPFVLGVEIRLSGRHEKDSCICDQLKGEYPKDFLFLGWHPQCLCQSIPILMSKEEFINYNNKKNIKKSSYIRYIPDSTQKYLKNNIDKIRKWKNIPYFIKDNLSYYNNI